MCLIEFGTSCGFMLLYLLCVHAEHPPGHLKALGSLLPPVADVPHAKHLSPKSFYEKYVKNQKPVVLRGLLKNTKPVQMWDDSYIKLHFGDEEIDVDLSKTENRSIQSQQLKFEEFIEQYKGSSSMYLISTLPDPMQEEFPLPSPLKCDGFMNRMQDFVLWFSSGGTKSRLHVDNVENLYCQLDGEKEWFMVDPDNSSKHITMDHPEGQFSGVNVSAVDLLKYPGLENIPWWKATSREGDCIYVPVNWWHQVTSSDGRNMAMNLWWAPILKGSSLIELQCNDDITAPVFLSDLQFNYGEWIKWTLAGFIQQANNSVDYDTIHRNIVHEHTGEKLVTEESFKLLDSNQDGFLELGELLKKSSDVIHSAVQYVEIGAMNTNGRTQTDDNDNFGNILPVKEEL